MSRPVLARGLLVTFVCTALVVSTAAAQDVAQDTRSIARAHFARGVELYDEGRLAQAAAEFREAYRLAPSAAVLFNVAQVEAELRHAVEAVDAYERILTDPAVTAPMRAESEAALRVQRARIATLRLSVNVAGARIAIDDAEVGTAPLAEVRVSEGEHVVTARADGYSLVSYRFVVAGGAVHDATLSLTLSGTSVGSLRVDARVPGLALFIDGSPYGLTPIESAIALSAGTHRVEARRPGYTLFSADVAVAPGGESHVSLVVEEDPSAPPSSRGTLVLSLPTTSTQLRIDGLPVDEADAFSLSLPAGLHDVEVRAAERETYAERIELTAGTPYDLRPAYQWTPDARQSRVSDAHFRVDLGVPLIVGGAVLLAAGVALAVYGRVRFDEQSGRLRSALEDVCPAFLMNPANRAPCETALTGLATLNPNDGLAQEQVQRLGGQLSVGIDEYYAALGIGVPVAVIGVGGLVAGIVLVATSSSEREIDRAARAARGPDTRFSVGPSSVTLSGTF